MNLKDVIIGTAIIILTISVFVFGVNTFYTRPEYSDFCRESFPEPPLSRPGICPAVCVEMYEISGNSCIFNECGSGCGPDGDTSFGTLAECEIALKDGNCYVDYEQASENYSRNIFLIALPIGILILALGAIVFGLEAVGAGIMGGGVGIILYGVGGFWRFAQNWLKFGLSLIGLIVVIWLAYWLNERMKKKVSRNRK
jgi:hypothetical protein